MSEERGKVSPEARIRTVRDLDSDMARIYGVSTKALNSPRAVQMSVFVVRAFTAREQRGACRASRPQSLPAPARGAR